MAGPETVAWRVLAGLAGPGARKAAGRVETWRDRSVRSRSITEAISEVMYDLADSARTGLELALPPGVKPQPTWPDALKRILADDDDFLSSLADQLAETTPGRVLTSEWSQLLSRVETAIDPTRSLDEVKRRVSVEVIVLLFAYRLDEDLFSPYVRLASAEARNRRLSADALASVIERVATTDELDRYLAAVIAHHEHDLPLRLGLQVSASQLHRNVTILSDDGMGRIDADGVMDHFDHVLIEGEPGSGKSWLAQRLVVNAALAARDQLRGGQSVHKIRIPVFASVSHVEDGADLWDRLVGQSVYRWPDDIRAKRILKDPNQSLLVVLDSYDESRRLPLSRVHLTTLRAQPRCQTVLTSRFGAAPPDVAGLFSMSADYRCGSCVLEPMTDSDSGALMAAVAAVIGFTHLPERIATLPSLRALIVAGNPLLAVLTVLALSSDHPDDGAAILCVPDLYRRAVWRVLELEAGRRRGHSPNYPDAELHRLRWMKGVAAFAWDAQIVLEPSGRRVLLDTIQTDTILDRARSAGFEPDEERLPLAFLVPVSPTERRFLHRTIQEHLIAQHASQLLAYGDPTAVRSLEFWPAWDEVAPAAILSLGPAGASAFIVTWCGSVEPGTGNDICEQRVGVLRRLAELSTPAMWTPSALRLIRQSLRTWADAETTRTRHWGPDHPSVPALLALLDNSADHEDIGPIARALVDIGGEPQRDHAVTALLTWLNDNPSSAWTDDIARALVDIGGEPQRHHAVTALLTWLNDNPNGVWIGDIARALVDMGGEPQRERAVTALLTRLTNDPNHERIGPTARAVVDIGGEPQRERAATALLTRLTNDPNHERIGPTARALVDIGGEPQRDHAVTALLAWLDNNRDHGSVQTIVSALADLVREPQRERAVTALLAWITSEPNHGRVDTVARLVVVLGGEPPFDRAISVLRAKVASSPQTDHIGAVTRALVTLGGDPERDQAVTLLLMWLANNPDRERPGTVAHALTDIVRDPQRERVVTSLLAWLDDNPGSVWIEEIAAVLVKVVDDPQRVRAVASLRTWLTNNPDRSDLLALALVDIGGDSQRDYAVTALLKHAKSHDTVAGARALVKIGGDRASRWLAATHTYWLQDALERSAAILAPAHWDQLISDLRNSSG